MPDDHTGYQGGLGGQMDLMGSFRVLRRRWILASALLLLTLLGTAAAAIKLPWSYQAMGTVVLLNSKHASASTDNNPMLAFDSSLASTAEVLSLAVMAPHTIRELQAHGYPNDYQVAVSSATGGPIMQVTVTEATRSPWSTRYMELWIRSVPSFSVFSLASPRAI